MNGKRNWFVQRRVNKFKERCRRAEEERFNHAWNELLDNLNRDQPKAFEWLMESKEREDLFKEYMKAGCLLMVANDRLIVVGNDVKVLK